eukprot:CFRG1850T1
MTQVILPVEIWVHIFDCMDPSTRLKCSTVCKEWNELACENDRRYWRNAISTELQRTFIQEEQIHSWRRFYIRSEFCRKLISHIRFCCVICVEEAAVECEEFLLGTKGGQFDPLKLQSHECCLLDVETVITTQHKQEVRQMLYDHDSDSYPIDDPELTELEGCAGEFHTPFPRRRRMQFDAAMLCSDMIFVRAMSEMSPTMRVSLAGSFGYFLYTHRHHFNRAIRFLQIALDKDPGALFSKFVMAHLVHFQLKDLDRAERLYTEVIDNAEDHFAEAYLRLAMVKWQKNDFAGAQRVYERALRLDENRERVLTHYANFKVVTGDYDGALAIVSKVVHTDPEDIHAVGTLALLLHLVKNEPTRARKLYMSILPLISNTGPHTFGVMVVYSYALLCALTGEMERAKAFWHKGELLDVFPETFEFIETHYLKGIAKNLPHYEHTASNLSKYLFFQDNLATPMHDKKT